MGFGGAKLAYCWSRRIAAYWKLFAFVCERHVVRSCVATFATFGQIHIFVQDGQIAPKSRALLLEVRVRQKLREWQTCGLEAETYERVRCPKNIRATKISHKLQSIWFKTQLCVSAVCLCLMFWCSRASSWIWLSCLFPCIRSSFKFNMRAPTNCAMRVEQIHTTNGCNMKADEALHAWN